MLVSFFGTLIKLTESYAEVKNNSTAKVKGVTHCVYNAGWDVSCGINVQDTHYLCAIVVRQEGIDAHGDSGSARLLVKKNRLMYLVPNKFLRFFWFIRMSG